MSMASSSQTEGVESPLVIPAVKEHKATLIFLHGLGDNGHSWAEQLKYLKFDHIKCICPHAPIQSVTVNRGKRMPSWFDVHGFEPSSPEDEASVKEASLTVQNLVEEEEKNGTPSSRIFLGGISQGGAVVLYTAFAINRPIGGVVALSTWFPLQRSLADQQVPKYNREVPVLLCHGAKDNLVKYSWGQLTRQFVESFNPNVQFITYDRLAHSTCLEEMRDIKKFLDKVVPS